MENYAAYFLSMQTIEIVLKVNECMVSINGFEKNGFEIKGISFQTISLKHFSVKFHPFSSFTKLLKTFNLVYWPIFTI